MSIFPEGDPKWFLPNGEGSYPKVKMTRMLRYQQGGSKHSHWSVQVFENEGDSDPRSLELDTWGDIERLMTERFGPAFRKQFPTAEDRGRDLLNQIARDRFHKGGADEG